MAIDPSSSEFEEDFLQRRLSVLRSTHPDHAELIRGLLDALDYTKATLKNRGAMRGLVFSLGSKLSRDPVAGAQSLQAWLERLAADGALSETQAQNFVKQACSLTATETGARNDSLS